MGAAMLRVLTLATLYPNGARPTFGGFVERQSRALTARDDVSAQVVAPIGLPLGPLSRHPHYAPLRDLPREEVRNGVHVHRPRYRVWPGLGQAGTARRMADALLPVLREIRTRFPFDVIDAEFFWPDGPAAMRLAAALGVPFAITARGSDIHFWGRQPGIAEQILAAARAADGLRAVSAALKRDMAALGLPDEKIVVHYTGVDLDGFRPVDRAAAKAALGVEGPLLISIGHLNAHKGQEIALAALAQIPDATLFLVGAGPEHGNLEREAKAKGLAARVRFLGVLPHDELPAVLAAADAMVLPTLTEGLANVWVEALACGTPVVTSDVGGAREVIDRPEAGRLVARDPAAVAAAVNALLADPPSQAAVRAAAERFSWERNAAETFEHLSGLVR